MAATNYDIIINGIKAKILQDGEGPGYVKRFVRREVQQQLVSQAQEPVLVSRDDYRQLYQTDWSGGSRWWKPLIGEKEINTYHKSQNMDLWNIPGAVVPHNKITTVVGGAGKVDIPAVMAASGPNAVYIVGSTTTDDATQRDVYKWNGSDWIRETGYSSGVLSNEIPFDTVFDPSDGMFYSVGAVSNAVATATIGRFDPAAATETKNWITGVTNPGRNYNFCITREGLFLYDGEKLFLVNKSTPALDVKVNDGMGLSRTPISDLPPTILAVGTPEGIYYAKNLMERGQSRGWIFRVDRDSSGAYITEPIAILPLGSFITSIAHHLGSLFVATATPASKESSPASGFSVFQATFYEVNSQSGLNVIGSPQARDALEDTIAYILGANGPLLFIGGLSSLWVYDAARGGVHRINNVTNQEAPIRSAAFYKTSTGTNFLALGYYPDAVGNNTYSFILSGANDLLTVAEQHLLESNYFDFNLPMELKELSKVEIQREKGAGNSTWIVQIEVDDVGWTTILTHATSGEMYASAALSGTTGRRFRYRLVYNTTVATEKKALQGLMITASTGQLITEYHLILDGSQLLNVDNEVQDEQEFFDALNAIAGTETYITLVDNMQEQDQETPTSSTNKFKVQAAEIAKTQPGGSTISLVLREA